MAFGAMDVTKPYKSEGCERQEDLADPDEEDEQEAAAARD